MFDNGNIVLRKTNPWWMSYLGLVKNFPPSLPTVHGRERRCCTTEQRWKVKVKEEMRWRCWRITIESKQSTLNGQSSLPTPMSARILYTMRDLQHCATGKRFIVASCRAEWLPGCTVKTSVTASWRSLTLRLIPIPVPTSTVRIRQGKFIKPGLQHWAVTCSETRRCSCQPLCLKHTNAIFELAHFVGWIRCLNWTPNWQFC